jgi:hypothetical protein
MRAFGKEVTSLYGGKSAPVGLGSAPSSYGLVDVPSPDPSRLNLQRAIPMKLLVKLGVFALNLAS